MNPKASWRVITGATACALSALFLLVYPVYVIRPFRFQGARELALALFLTRYRFTIELVLAAAALCFLFVAWRRLGSRAAKIVTSVCGFLVVVSAILSRVNVYELMFRPLDKVAFSPAAKAKLDADEQVIAIKVGGQARAYPVRSMSYHHIANDLLAGEPVVATY
jgi:Na+-transporting NADH:ubiquinone oxidoreductase subunit NqrB